VRLLIIEDDNEMAGYMARALTEQGFSVDHAQTGTDGLSMAIGGTYDMLIVDRMLPGLDGLGIISALRSAGHSVPALILSALGEVDERIRGLRAGGDDYMVKPFAFGELHARIEALCRRGMSAIAPTTLKVADLEMDLLSRTVKRGERKIILHPREFSLLEYLMRNANRVVSRTMLFEKVWDYHFEPQTNVIDVHIGRLRKKIDKTSEIPLINTVRGTGYSVNFSE
jgi:two-component system OmpR family response regulator